MHDVFVVILWGMCIFMLVIEAGLLWSLFWPKKNIGFKCGC